MNFIVQKKTAEAIKLTVEKEDKEIGRVFLYFIKNDLHDRPYVLLEDLFVAEEKRKQGVGAELIKKAIELSKEKGCYKILATSRSERKELHQWYEKKFGFRQHGYELRLDLD